MTAARCFDGQAFYDQKIAPFIGAQESSSRPVASDRPLRAQPGGAAAVARGERMTTTDYRTIAWDAYPEEMLLPVGTWRLCNTGVKLFQKTDKSPRVGFFYTAQAPLAVDPRELRALGDYDYTMNDLATYFWFSNGKDGRKIADHIKLHAGVTIPRGELLTVVVDGVEEINPKIREALKGAVIQGEVTHGIWNGRERNDIKSLAAVENEADMAA
jgi:hypothetical protein